MSPLALLVALAPGGGSAAPITDWQVASGSWFTPGNWTAGVPNGGVDATVANDGLAFVSTGTAQAAQLTVQGASRVIVGNGATLAVGGTGGTGSIEVDGGTIQASPPPSQFVAMDTAIVIGANGATMDSNGANVVSITGNISGGSGSLVKTGSGTLSLDGLSDYTGGTTINNGTVVYSQVDIDAATQQRYALLRSGRVPQSSVPDPVTLVQQGSSIKSSVGLGPVTLNGGALQFASNSFDFNRIVNNIDIGPTGGRLDSNGTAVEVLGSIGQASGSPGTLILTNSGSGGPNHVDFDLYRTGTFSGLTRIGANTLVINDADNSLGVGSLQVDAGGIFDISGHDQTLTALTGQGTIRSSGYFDFEPGILSTLHVASGSFQGAIQDGTITAEQSPGDGNFQTFTGRAALEKTSSAVLILSGINTYSGPTTVSVGSLVAGSNTAFSPNSDFTVAPGATLDLAGFSNTIGSLAGAGLVTTTTGRANLAVGNSGQSTVFAGLLADGPSSLSLSKVGAGALTLSGANTFSGGTLLRQGTLGFTNSTLNAGAVVSSSLGTGAVTLNGGTLQFDAPNTLVEVGNTVVVGPAGGTIDSNGSYPRFSADIVDGTTPGVLTFANSVGRVGENIDIILYGRNTTTGGAVVANGVDVSLGTANGIGLGPLTVNGSFNLGSQNQAVTTLAGSGGYIYATGLGAPTGSSNSILTVQSGDYGGGLYDGTGTYGSTTQGKLGLTKISDGSASGGTLRLFGATGTSRFAYSGLTDIAAGRLLAGSAEAFSPKSPVQIEAAGSLDLGGFSNTVASLSGRGRVTNSGTTSAVLTLGGSPGATFSGTVTDGVAPVGLTFMGGAVMAGASTYSGPTTIASGVVQAGSLTGLSPNSAFDIASGAALDLGGYSNSIGSLSGSGSVFTSGGPANLTVGRDGLSTSFTGTLSDGPSALSLTKIGAGTLTLAGANSFSGGTFLDAGTLAVSNAAALGTGTLNMAPGTTLAFANSLTLPNPVALTAAGDPTIDTGANDVTLSGPIAGPGDLTKAGSGTLDLTGVNTYTGATNVAQGTLLVDGSTANSAVSVQNGARLGGSGTIGSLNLLSGATLAPGAATPLSTLTVLGNATLQPDSTYFVNISPNGQSDRLVVSGLATVNGATLSVNTLGAGFTPNTRYSLLAAAGGVVGQFATVNAGSSDLAFLSPSVSYAPGTADLVFTQTAPLASAGVTPNQRAVATAIDALGRGNRLYDAIIGLDPVGARQAFQATQGDTHASAMTTAVQSNRVVSSIIFDRLWNLPIPQAGDALDALKQFEPHNLPALLQCYAPVTAPTTGVRPGAGYTVWGQAIGDFGHTASDGNASGVDRTLGGFVLGIDSRIDAKALQNWRVGVAGGYTNTQFSVKSGGNGTFENVFGTLYAGARYGNLTLRFGGTYGSTQTNATRTVAFPGFFETERSNNGGDTLQAFGEIGYRISTPSVVVEPILNGAVTHTHQDRYREKGGDAALIGAEQDVDVGSTVLGVRSEALPFGTLPIVARAFLGWQHTYGDINPAAILAFAAGGPAFSSYGTPLDRNAIVAEAGLDWRVTTAVSLGLTYFGQAGERSMDNAVKGRMEYRF